MEGNKRSASRENLFSDMPDEETSSRDPYADNRGSAPYNPYHDPMVGYGMPRGLYMVPPNAGRPPYPPPMMGAPYSPTSPSPIATLSPAPVPPPSPLPVDAPPSPDTSNLPTKEEIVLNIDKVDVEIAKLEAEIKALQDLPKVLSIIAPTVFIFNGKLFFYSYMMTKRSFNTITSTFRFQSQRANTSWNPVKERRKCLMKR